MVEEDEETPVDEPTPLLETEEVGRVDLGRGERGEGRREGVEMRTTEARQYT